MRLKSTQTRGKKVSPKNSMGWDWGWLMAFSLFLSFFERLNNSECDRPSLNPFKFVLPLVIIMVLLHSTGVGPAKAVNLIRKHKHIEEIMKHNSVSGWNILKDKRYSLAEAEIRITCWAVECSSAVYILVGHLQNMLGKHNHSSQGSPI